MAQLVALERGLPRRTTEEDRRPLGKGDNPALDAPGAHPLVEIDHTVAAGVEQHQVLSPPLREQVVGQVAERDHRVRFVQDRVHGTVKPIIALDLTAIGTADFHFQLLAVAGKHDEHDVVLADVGQQPLELSLDVFLGGPELALRGALHHDDLVEAQPAKLLVHLGDVVLRPFQVDEPALAVFVDSHEQGHAPRRSAGRGFLGGNRGHRRAEDRRTQQWDDDQPTHGSAPPARGPGIARSLIPQRWNPGLTSLKAQAKGVRKHLSFNCPSLALRLVARDFPGIVCILDGDRSGAVELRDVDHRVYRTLTTSIGGSTSRATSV